MNSGGRLDISTAAGGNKSMNMAVGRDSVANPFMLDNSVEVTHDQLEARMERVRQEKKESLQKRLAENNHKVVEMRNEANPKFIEYA